MASIVWVGAGAVVAGAFYWAFLNTPESNVLTLALSALLVLAVLVVLAVAVSGAVIAARERAFSATTARRAAAAVPLFLAALPPALVLAWLTARGHQWLTDHSGEISAWFIASLGWSDVGWLIDGAGWVLTWIAWVVGPVLTLSLLSWLTTRERTGGALRWAIRVWHWRVLGLATLWFVLLVALPWQAASWRPPGMPSGGTMEPVLAALKLAVIAVVMTVGATLMIRAASAGPPPARGA
ncbi:MAG: hypothetical protein AB7O67_02390 [Vicinamibacterales bacterium]